MRGIAQAMRGRLALTVALVLVVALIPAGHADAGVLGTSTRVTAAPTTAPAGTLVTLRAAVRDLGLGGLGVTPRGTVTFVSSNGAGATANLGTVSLSPCLLAPCVATLRTSTAPVGTTSVTATYHGDALSAPSKGSTTLHITPDTNLGDSSTVTCYSGQPCDSGTVTSTDGTTQLEVDANPSANNQTVSASLGTGQLSCPLFQVFDQFRADATTDTEIGALASFSSTAPDAAKTVTYTGEGTAEGTVGFQMLQQYDAHPEFAGCYGSTTEFDGYTNGNFGPAPFDQQDGLFEAQLSNCANNDGQLPCFTNVSSATNDSYVVQTLPGDPKLQGGPVP